jgi:hypothetical protein
MEFANTNIKDLACFIYEILKSNGIDAVLVGGACVSIYSQNRYQSYDLDFVTYEELKLIEKALAKIGFKRTGRCFAHEDCPYLIDFVNPPIAIGNEPIRHFETLKTPAGSLQLLTPTDCVKDRLSSFFHWNDEQALEQALLVANDHPIDLNDIKRWAKTEGHEEKMKFFLKKLRKDLT